MQTKSSPTDIVTEMDRAAEQLIRGRLLAARPDDAILGEEGGRDRRRPRALDRRPARRHRELPVRAARLGGQHRRRGCRRRRRGAVCVPLRRAVLHRDARRRRLAAVGMAGRTAAAGLQLRRAARPRPGRHRLRLPGAGSGQTQGTVVAAVLPRVRDIRRAGSAAADLCSVAAGLVDAYYEQGVHYWDIAAGGLIAREAGAVMGGLRRPAGRRGDDDRGGPDAVRGSCTTCWRAWTRARCRQSEDRRQAR